VACPFFSPTERFEGITAPHRLRLPLGDGWKGQCAAPGHEHSEPDAARLSQCCNLGYASSCAWLPAQRDWDAVRFAVVMDRDHDIHLLYVCEAAHRPGAHGTLEFDVAGQRWRRPHSDTRIQRLATCYLESYLLRRRTTAAAIT
jgi:hypothetical protein